MPRRTPRVFIGLTEVAGVFTSLQQGFEELGVHTMRIDAGGNPRRYRPGGGASGIDGGTRSIGALWAQLAPSIEVAWAAVGRRRRLGPAPARAFWVVLQAAVLAARSAYRVVLLMQVIAAYDVVIVTGRTSFFRGHELRLLRRLGKRVVVVFTGSDHRPPYLNGGLFRTMSTAELLAEADRIRDFLALAERHATAIVALSSSAQFHRRPFIHLLAVGIPFAPPLEIRPTARAVFNGSGVRILHCPTDPISKGTPEVRAMMERLRVDGLSVDYQELIGRPHAEVLAALAECDFAIDELHSDTPLGRFATEAAWYGKPAVTGGEYAREIAMDLPPTLVPPSVFVASDDVEATVRRFIVDNDYRLQQGATVQAFIREEWRPSAVANRFLRIVQGDIPAQWMYDPARLEYVAGWGLGAKEWRACMSTVLEATDASSLGIPERLMQKVMACLGEDPRR
jgi:hypothetical protein